MRCKNCKKSILPGQELHIVGMTTLCSKKCKKEFIKKSKEEQREKKLIKLEKDKTRKIKKIEKRRLSVSRLIKDLDSVFSKYIRLRDAIQTTGTKTHLACYTCDTLTEVSKAQNMHFIPRATKSLRHNEDNCHGGCMICNVMKHGNYIEYFVRMEKQYGRAKVDEMISKKNEIGKYTSQELLELIEVYKNKLKQLGQE